MFARVSKFGRKSLAWLTCLGKEGSRDFPNLDGKKWTVEGVDWRRGQSKKGVEHTTKTHGLERGKGVTERYLCKKSTF